MSTTSRLERTPLAVEEEKLFQGLFARGWLMPEEVQEFRVGRSGAEEGARELLLRLVQGGYLTQHQCQRATRDLETILGQQIPGFALLEKIGEGAMGRVFKARQLSMDRLVAIKVLPAALAADPDYLERFRREAHMAAKLNCNNVVQAIDVGSVGPVNYFVMEYVEGVTVKDELDKGKVYGEEEAIQIALQVAQALDHAFRRQLIHRDVKPSNVILTKDGVAKLADLGLARLVDDEQVAASERGATIGTPYYIAPELIGGMQHVDIRADVYSLGATLYHMVTGQLPFAGDSVQEVFRAHLHKELTPPDHLNPKLSAGLGEVVEMMMAKNRDDRYQTPAELVTDLECLLRGEGPRMARHRREFDALEALTEGQEAVVAEEAADELVPAWSWRSPWTVGLAIAIAVSVFLNLLLLTLLAR